MWSSLRPQVLHRLVVVHSHLETHPAPGGALGEAEMYDSIKIESTSGYGYGYGYGYGCGYG